MLLKLIGVLIVAVFGIHRITFSPSGQLGPSLANVELGVSSDSSISFTTPATIPIDRNETYLVIYADTHNSSAIPVEYSYATSKLLLEEQKFIFKATNLTHLNQFHLEDKEMYMHAYSMQRTFSHSVVVTEEKIKAYFKLGAGSKVDKRLSKSQWLYNYTPSPNLIPPICSQNHDLYKCKTKKCEAFIPISAKVKTRIKCF